MKEGLENLTLTGSTGGKKDRGKLSNNVVLVEQRLGGMVTELTLQSATKDRKLIAHNSQSFVTLSNACLLEN